MSYLICLFVDVLVRRWSFCSFVMLGFCKTVADRVIKLVCIVIVTGWFVDREREMRFWHANHTHST